MLQWLARHGTVALFLGIGFALARAASSAANPPAWTDADREIRDLENRAFASKSKARYDECLPLFRAAIELATESGSEEGSATAEVLLLAWDRIVRNSDAYEGAVEWLRSLRDRVEDPLLRARVDFLEARAARALGEPTHEWAPREGTGFLCDWLLVGPFDNDQGSGFDRPYPPEEGFDPQGTYPDKGRTARWRRIPERTRAYIPLDSLFDPNEQVLAYAATTLRCEEATAVAFRVASGGGIRLWVDGTRILSRPVRRSPEFDQDACGVLLPPGIHRVLVKSTQQSGPWGFAIRITDPEGKPLAGVVADATPEAIAEASAVESLTPVPVRAGAAGFYRTATADRPDDARIQFRAALFSFLLGADDPSEETTLGWARRAVELAPRDPHARYLLALASAPAVKMRPEIELNEQRRHLEEVLELDPDHAEAAVMLASYYTQSIRIPERALALCDRALATNPHFVQARVLRSSVLDQSGLAGLAEADVHALEAAELAADPDALVARARQLAGRNRPGDAADLARRALAGDRTDSVLRQYVANLERNAGRYDEALDLLSEELRADPLSVATLAARASLFETQERWDTALQEIDRALEIAPEKPGLWRAKATITHRMDREGEALEAFRTARGLDPKDRWLERYLEFLEAEARPFEDAFPIDVEAIVAEASTWASDPDAPYRYLLWRSIVKLEEDGTASRYHHFVVEARNTRGARDLARIRVAYRPESQRLRLRFARLCKAGGEILLGQLAGGDGGSGVRWIELPVVEVGDRVEIAYRIDDVRAGLFGSYFGDRAFFQRPDLQPTRLARFTLVTPESTTLTLRERNGAPPPEIGPGDESGWVTRTWEMRDLPRVEREPQMPPPEELFPHVEITTYRSWDEFARWWWSLLEKEFTVSDRMRELVAEVTAASPSRDERIRRLYEYVATKIRYVAWEFGIHGYQPYNASTIFARKFGDCKDKAILLRTLLGEAGIESHPVVLEAETYRGEQDLATPLLEQFNHCILYVPLGPEWEADPAGRGIFLDGTAQFNDWQSLPSGDRGGRALIVPGRSAHVVEIPEVDPLENLLEFDERVTVHGDGSADVHGTVRARGTAAAQVRASFLNVGNREEQVSNRLSAHFGRVEVRSLRFSDLADLEVPPEYEYEIHVPEFLTRRGRDFTVPVLFSAPSYGDAASLEERKFDLLLSGVHAWKARVVFEIAPPLEARVFFDDVALETDFADFRLATERESQRLVVESSLVTKVRRISAERYPAFRDFSRKLDQAAREQIHLEMP